jgi:hypothetical protein
MSPLYWCSNLFLNYSSLSFLYGCYSFVFHCPLIQPFDDAYISDAIQWIGSYFWQPTNHQLGMYTKGHKARISLQPSTQLMEESGPWNNITKSREKRQPHRNVRAFLYQTYEPRYGKRVTGKSISGNKPGFPHTSLTRRVGVAHSV